MSANPITENPQELAIFSPASGKEIGRVPIEKEPEVREKVEKARAAQKVWAAVPLKERIRYMRRFRDELLARQDEIIKLLVAENGKTVEEAVFMEIVPVANISSWFCAKAPRLLKPKKVRAWVLSATRKTYIHYAPRGVIAIVSPWNFPFSIPTGSVFPALLAGNAAVVKPSEWTPLIMVKLKEIFDRVADARMPKDLLQVVTGDPATGAALLAGGIDKVDFTGSVSVGQKIGKFCGENLIPFTLELGGKAPAIVLDDANLDRAAHSIAWGAFANSGQVCVSVERVLVDKSIAPKLTQKIVDIVSKLRQGDPSMAEVDVGAMTFPKQLETVERLVDDAKQRGAKVLTGGRRLPGRGRFYSPTVLSGVTPDMPIARQEIFGPAVPIIEVDGEEEAIRIANDSHLGLNAYVFTKNRARARRISERIRSGGIMVNDVLGNYAMAEVPFGGVKQSGLGRVHGEGDIQGMCEARVINVDRFPAPAKDLWMYPYNRKLVATLQKHVIPRLGRILDMLGWLA